MKNLLAIFLIVMGCTSTQTSSESDNINSREITLEINHYKAACQGEYLTLCFMVKQDGQHEWNYFYDDIENFYYQWGHLYSLRVREKDLDPTKVPADASSKKYELIEVKYKNKAPEGETFFINNLEGLIHSTKDSRRHVQNQFIKCISQDVCNQMESLLQEQDPFNGLFEHGDNQGEIKLLSLEKI